MSPTTAFVVGAVLGSVLTGGLGWYLHRRFKRRLGRFLSFASHEVNSPATAINMTAVNFLGGIFGEIPKDHRRWFELLRAQSHRLGTVLGEIRDWIHWEVSEDLVVMTSETSLAEAVEHSLEALQTSISSEDAPLEVDIPKDLPPIIADPDRLSRSVSSLLLHAKKFRTTGSIKLSAANSGGVVALTFEYQGAPMAEIDVRESLETYYPAATRHGDLLCAVGTGLGVVRGLAKFQGGDLALAVDKTGFTSITLTAPVKKGD